jgi:hypothetical protein
MGDAHRQRREQGDNHQQHAKSDTHADGKLREQERPRDDRRREQQQQVGRPGDLRPAVHEVARDRHSTPTCAR